MNKLKSKACGKRPSKKDLCKCMLPKDHFGPHKCHCCKKRWN